MQSLAIWGLWKQKNNRKFEEEDQNPRIQCATKSVLSLPFFFFPSSISQPEAISVKNSKVTQDKERDIRVHYFVHYIRVYSWDTRVYYPPAQSEEKVPFFFFFNPFFPFFQVLTPKELHFGSRSLGNNSKG